jgi:hypothetical protein
VVPEEYQRNMIGVKGNLRRVLEIAESVSDPRIKLDAIRVANDCYKIIMDLCSNASVVEQALVRTAKDRTARQDSDYKDARRKDRRAARTGRRDND